MEKFYLVDASGFIFRAYHALPKLNRPDGTPVGAVMGFCNMLVKLIDEIDAHYLLAVFDAGRKTFRNEIFPDYKSHRPDPPEDLIPQFSLIREACKAFNVPSLEMAGFEADDLIATLSKRAKKEGFEVVIISADKDLMQLVEPNVSMLDPLKNKVIGADEVFEKFGVSPDKVIDVQALIGDASDFVPGVPSIGPKTAAELINTYGDFENLFLNLDQIRQEKRKMALKDNEELARISKQLVTLKKDVPLDVSLDDFKVRELEFSDVRAFLEEQNFKTLLQRLQKKHATPHDMHVAPQKIQPLQSDLFGAPNKVSFDKNYECVLTLPQLDAWIEKAMSAGKVAFDTETTSLQSLRANLVGFSLCVEEGKACYVPLQHVGPDGQKIFNQLNFDDVLLRLKKLLEAPDVLKIGHNIKYDMNVMSRYNIHLVSYDDTMVMSYVLDNSKNGHGMDELATLHLNTTVISYSDVTGSGKNKISFEQVDLEKATAYASEDADITMRLYNVFRERLNLERMQTLYVRMERPLINVLARVEQNGFLVDAHHLEKLSHTFAQQIELLEKEIFEHSGREFNVASPKQLGEILFEEMKLPGGKIGKSGAYSTSADVLENLSQQGHVIAEKILKWRALAKLKSTYTDSLPLQIDPKTSRIHTNFSQTITSTGRLSSNDPNLQNIPIKSEQGRQIRHAFIAQKGFKIVTFDYSQIELRLLAHMADVKLLKQAFLSGVDIHQQTAAHVFHVDLSDVTSELRRRAKAVNFGIIYGISAYGLSQQIGVSMLEANQLIDQYFKKYPEVPRYMDQIKNLARKNRFVETLMKRKCFIQDIYARAANLRQFAERQAINAPLQGTAADLIKIAMIRVDEALKKQSMKVSMILQVHDELVFEVEEHQVQALIDVVRPAMENVFDLDVPLVVDVGIGDNWDDAH